MTTLRHDLSWDLSILMPMIPYAALHPPYTGRIPAEISVIYSIRPFVSRIQLQKHQSNVNGQGYLSDKLRRFVIAVYVGIAFSTLGIGLQEMKSSYGPAESSYNHTT